MFYVIGMFPCLTRSLTKHDVFKILWYNPLPMFFWVLYLFLLSIEILNHIDMLKFFFPINMWQVQNFLLFASLAHNTWKVC